jgi:hypothetical protein
MVRINLIRNACRVSTATLLLTFAGVPFAQQQQPHPILDAVAEKVIAKYQNSTCDQLRAEKSAKKTPSAEEQKAIQALKNDPQMRTIFLNKVAAPIANKMFTCGMIP